jgi:hypothetical protein
VQTIDNFLIPPANFISTCPLFNLTGIGGAVTKASLDTYFNTAKDLTIFAPNNAAFQKLGSALLNMSVSDLSEILNYHVVNSNPVRYSSTLHNGTKLRTRQGGELTITSASNSLFVNSARILEQDILLSNGVVHIIDNLLNYNVTGIPPLPAIETQPPVIIPGSALDEDLVLYATYLPPATGIGSFAGGTMMDGSSVGVGGTGTAASDSVMAMATATRSARAGQRQSSPAGRREIWNGGVGFVLGALVWMEGWILKYL